MLGRCIDEGEAMRRALHHWKTGSVQRIPHYILGPFGQDSDLRRWGLRLAERGAKSAKKKAVVAVARKLTVLLHRLSVSGKEYQPIGHGSTVAA